MTEIRDTDFYALCDASSDDESAGFVYIDQTGKRRFVSLKACADNYQKAHAGASGVCAGDRNILEYAFIFYCGDETLKVVFVKHFVWNFSQKRLFRGTRDMRFHRFQKWIHGQGYTTFDLS